ncbi:MAG: CYTH and CHAD domain-containing protein [Rhodospirillales bacterium]|nr:CYTH and CHAD domain-containing protein [Rhodospirillales bacterium]
MTEVELKLAAEPAALKRLASAPALTARTRGKVVTLDLDNRYFDTADLKLYHNRLALRVRKTDGHYVQTLKADPDASEIMRRGEWEAPVGSARPDLDVLPDPLPVDHRLRLRADRLKSLFSSRIRRQVRIIEIHEAGGATTTIEVSIDRGVVATKRRSLAVSEIELQLVNGNPEALYRVAMDLQRIVPLRLMSLSKSARGYGLAAGLPPRWRKAERIRLDADATVEDVWLAVAKACQSHWTANGAAAVDGRNPEGVHQVRVALRRLRSALAVFADLLPEDQRAWLKTEAKWIVSALGPAREWDVLATQLLPTEADDDIAAGPLKALRAAVERQRHRAYERARRALGSARYTRLQLRLGMWIEGRGWRADDASANAGFDAPAVAFATSALTARHRKVVKLGDNFAELSAQDLHKVRLALKKLRYAAEFFRSLHRKREVASYLKRLTRLQDDLGRYNDVAVTETLLKPRRIGGRDGSDVVEAATAVIALHHRRLKDGEKALRRAWRNFVHAQPFWSDEA